MIVDFVSIKEKLHKITDILLREEVKKRAPMLNIMGKRYVHEGKGMSYETVEHEKKDLEIKKAESGFTLSREEMGVITYEEIIKKIQQSAEDMAGQIERGLFQTFNEAIERTGNVIPGNPKFSPDAFLQGMELVDIDFEDDDRDKPRLPTVVMHPSQLEKLKEEEKNATKEEIKEFKKKQKAILDKKYAEFMQREEKRKLVD